MNKVLIKDINVILENEVLSSSDVLIEDGKIIKIGKNIDGADTLIDGKDKNLMPGFIDVHVHGAVGYDFMDANAEGNAKVAAFKASKGCTSFVATTLTGTKESLLNALKAVSKTQEMEYDGAEIIGVHMEGPFFNIDYKGAQNPNYITNPMIEDIKEYMAVKDGLLKMMSLAPEKDGALEAIEFMSDRGIVVSAGHTGATCCQMKAAVEKGLRHSTHTFNGMRGLHHREPGTVGAVMLEDKIYAEAIFDTIHLNPDIVKLLVKVKGTDKLILITDAMQAVGLQDGEYDLGGLKVNVKDGAARLLDGTLAGSCLTMEEAFKNSLKYLELNIWDVAKITSRNAANQLGVKKGKIAEGYDADLLIMDKDYNIEQTMVAGKIVYKK